MNYLESIGKNAKKAFEDLKGVKHKKIKKVLENFNQSLLKNSASGPKKALSPIPVFFK